MNASLLLVIAAALANEAPAVAVPASATDALPLTLSWSAPAECPDENAVREEIHNRLSVDVRPAGTIDAQVVIVATSGGRDRLHLHTRVDNQDGERTISHEDCSQLTQAAALVIALLIDPNASATPLKRPPPPEPSRPPQPAAPPSSPAATPPFRRTSIGIAADAGYGRLPGLADGGHAQLARNSRRGFGQGR